MTSPHDSTLQRFEDALAVPDASSYELILFVSGASDLSARAIANATRLFDEYLPGRYELTVIEVHEDIAAVIDNRVLATPTLVKKHPLPERKVVGDLSHTDRVLRALDMPFTTEAGSDRVAIS